MAEMNREDYPKIAAKAVSSLTNKKFYRFFTREEKEDMISDVTIKMLENDYRFDSSKGTIEGWAWTIARNTVYSAASKRCHYDDYTRSLDGNDYSELFRENCICTMEAAPDYNIRAKEIYNLISGKMPNERYQMYFNWLVEGYDNIEMAEMDNTSVDNTYQMVRKVRKKAKMALNII